MSDPAESGGAPVFAPGQCAVDLFDQAERRGVGATELRRLRQAVGLAASLFAGRVHASGKEYVAHGVGSAGVLLACAADIDVVIAGVLHGAYAWGDFGPARPLLAMRRRWMRARIGAAAEGWVERFRAMPWNPAALRTLVQRRAALDAATRTVVLMRLASELDNLRDRSPLYAVDAERRVAALAETGPLLVELADGLEQPELSAALGAALAALREGGVAPELRTPLAGGTLLAPESARRRPSAVVSAWLRHLWRSNLDRLPERS